MIVRVRVSTAYAHRSADVDWDDMFCLVDDVALRERLMREFHESSDVQGALNSLGWSPMSVHCAVRNSSSTSVGFAHVAVIIRGSQGQRDEFMGLCWWPDVGWRAAPGRYPQNEIDARKAALEAA